MFDLREAADSVISERIVRYYFFCALAACKRDSHMQTK